jgi:hypothetical protein
MSLGLIRRSMRLGTSVASVAPEAAVWHRRAARAEAREMVALAAPDAAGPGADAGSCAGRPAAVRLARLVGSTRGVSHRRVARRVLRASPVARMVALAAAAVMVTAVATLVLVVVAIAQLV